jgi:hypothetical protein
MKVVILNLNILSDQFPNENSELLTAEMLFNVLNAMVNESVEQNILNLIYSIPCNRKSDAIAQFELEGKVGNTLLFNNIGTAN